MRGEDPNSPVRPVSVMERGEDIDVERIKNGEEETPPHTRGRRIEAGKQVAARGNTPAYAGKTSAEALQV